MFDPGLNGGYVAAFMYMVLLPLPFMLVVWITKKWLLD